MAGELIRRIVMQNYALRYRNNRWRSRASAQWKCLGMALVVAMVRLVKADGIPEPSLMLYGVIQNGTPQGTTRLTSGTLTWVFQPTDGSPAVTMSTPVTNVNDQFSYVLRVPCETEIVGLTISTGALKLAAAGTRYNRSQVSINGTAASFASPDQANLVLAPTDRGRIERVDLTIGVISGGGVLPDAWQLQYFGHTGVDPNADPDKDGMTNLQEYLAGTDPNDPQSKFKIVDVGADPAGGVRVRWSSVASKFYAVQRAADLRSGFSDIQTQVAATPPLNTYRDANATGRGPYFYRLRIDAGSATGGNVLPDAWQLQYFGRTGIDPNDDPDQDGQSNWAEFVAGTNPTDKQSRLAITVSRPTSQGARVQIGWASVANKSYTLQRTTDLRSGFTDLQTHIAATAPLNSYQDGSASGPGPYFYRLRVEQ